MFSVPSILMAITVYLTALIVAGRWADRSPSGIGGRHLQPLFYGLSLATLCSAWTYFGGVGDAGKGSWLYVANALGPVLAITLGYPVWRRIAVLSKQENVGSLADFLAARYGKSRALGILTACVASLGALPYIALQLSVLTHVWAFATGNRAPGGAEAFVLIVLLAGIAIIFGTRRPSLTQHNRGFVGMIAIEACVKLAGLLGVAGLGVVLLARAPAGWHLALAALPPPSVGSAPTFLTLVVLCTVTAFTLPRQFHLGFVTLEREGDIRGAVWVVPIYFTLWVAATLLIALAIRAGAGMPGGDPYMQVLAVPMLHGNRAIALLALLGGLSAGAAMVVVETTAISAMVSNEIVLPLFARSMRTRLSGENIGGSILLVRRVTILAIAGLALLYYLGIGGSEAPTELGLTALTASAQFLPALIGGIYWRGGHARGAIAGICAGMAVWAVAIAAPAFLPDAGPGLAGDALWGSFSRFGTVSAIFTSLAVNIALFVLISLRSTPRLIDTIQANSFVARSPRMPAAATGRIAATVGDLRRLLAQFLGQAETDRALLGLRVSGSSDGQEVSPNLVRAAERLLAGVIGAPSARNVMALALAAETQDARDISRILDEAGHAVHFSRELLQTTLDSLPQGVSVIDDNQQLIAWNTRFLHLVELPMAEVHVGKSLPELLAAADRPLRRHIAGRLATVGDRRPFEDEIPTADGRVLRLTGLPLAGGDYLATLADITDLRQAERVLARSNEELEQRVEERTCELAAAKAVAEQATGAQRRFVAAASHDLVQPLHAARLFIGNALVGVEADSPVVPLLQRADQAVEGAHRLLRALLNLSQLEIGALHPRLEPVDGGALLASLADEFAAEASTRGLELVLLPTTAWVRSDRDLLRSMLQNLLLNALRYTARGRVVVALRRAGHDLRFEVRDTGIGIAPEHLPAAFGEYSRLTEGRAMAGGAGLGLSIVARIAQVLGHPVAVRSRPGVGSVFSVTVPAATPMQMPARLVQPAVDLGGLRVLCVDDERDVLFGTGALIERWGGVVSAHDSAEAALATGGTWDVAIADYHLGGMDGLTLLRRLAGAVGTRLLITALPSEDSLAPLAQEGIACLAKPLAPLALRAILTEAVSGQPGDGRINASN